ncbi:DNA-binding transcriptional LysR family regulator [Phycicoccus badiiscoriae]|uniref:DNA-binding transcriptional LysR family regulator n=1 Tax=Pedococcus badiiscoriae TaxID=642776 RepID=A0A852WAS1_9MICO|nr:LysR family transcriptional regulator [Pedococcus badiiscoriae]NYG06148.1 DNA-binding transcriptional LysR family regulator [Pedococcus badiiscoriae]
MEIRTLRYVIAVADEGSVTAAATAVHVTQPSLSRQIRQLEREIGVDLFVRDEGRLRLSAAGAEFLPVARSLVAQAEAAHGIAASIAAGRLQHITIAAPGTTLTDVVAPFLATLEPDDPMPAVLEEVPASVYTTLTRGADLAIGTTPPPVTFTGMALADLPVWAYVPRTHDWAHRGHISLEELVERRLLTQRQDFHPRRALDSAVASARLAYTELHEFGSPEVAQAVAASGRGVAVVSDDPRFDLHPLAIDTPSGPVGISLYTAWDGGHHGAATISRFATRLAAFCVARYGEQVAPPRRRAPRPAPAS